ncbi:AAA family ATPase [Denitratisoma oestradiolicum]|uniref:ATPase n=1 Tax=Denitratisoma oestradiolicum TaxID=311182 RepID=A0A6S6YKZ8_9PROT|nr:MoxR family ATPase [Denitratisoma oestradiolicum]TWO79499.1 ATPase [Denitratisoma oestradiolicum]CAB1368404.1 ATPase [Denitratisoma oestradiolicum]
MSGQEPRPGFASIEEVQQKFAAAGYIADRMLATTMFLSVSLGKPVFLEGEPGVGKTEIAKVMAQVLDAELIRLQCYEGLDSAAALYEWNYTRQLLELRLQEARGVEREQIGRNLFSEEFLLQRPLLKALRSGGVRPPVLLIDEVDRSDEEFEAFLLEVLSDFQITIPEIGTLRAHHVPFVILTSNRTREVHDALKRRCLYHWIDYPSFDKEVRILRSRLPEVELRLAGQVCRFMELLREQDFYKRPGIAETIDWARALLALGIAELDTPSTAATLGCILKYKGDMEKLHQLGLEGLIEMALMPGHDPSAAPTEFC